MPILSPQELRDDAPYSEKLVWTRMVEVLPDDWVLLSRRRIVTPNRSGRGIAEGECDLVLLNPRRGIIGLEVKGGRIRYEDGVWSTTDRNGQTHRLNKDPGEQSQRAVHKLVEFFRQRPQSNEQDRRLRYAWGVVLPDTFVQGPLGPSLPRELIIDKEDLMDLPGALDRMADAHELPSGPISAATQQRLLSAVNPLIDLVPSLASRIRLDERALIQLTQEQVSVLDLLEDAKRVAVRGGAGTGKTLIGLELARRWADEGHRVLFLCFNRFLAERLAENASNFTIKHFHGFCRDRALAGGVRFTPPHAKQASEVFWKEEAPSILEQTADRLPDDRWDAIVVDEAQDFQELWWLALQSLLSDPQNGRLWAFYDPKQNIYDGELERLPPISRTIVEIHVLSQRWRTTSSTSNLNSNPGHQLARNRRSTHVRARPIW